MKFSVDSELCEGLPSAREALRMSSGLCRVAETDPASGDLGCFTTPQRSARDFPLNALVGLVSPAWIANNTDMAQGWYARPGTRQQQTIRAGGFVTRRLAGVTAPRRHGMYLREKSQANPKSRLERCRPLPGSRGVRSAVTIATATGEWLHTKVAHRKPGPSNVSILGGLVYAGLVHHRKSHIATQQA